MISLPEVKVYLRYRFTGMSLPEVHADGVGEQKGVVHGSQELFIVIFICRRGTDFQ